MVAVAPLLVIAALPEGNAPPALRFEHFPSPLHAVVWRNWELVPAEQIAAVVGAEPAQIAALAERLGLPPQAPISDELRRRTYITVIRRNWHLLPYDQLLGLLGWNEEQLAFTLKEDDFLWHKLGAHKPRCEPVRWAEPDEATRAAEAAIADLAAPLCRLIAERPEPLFGFLDELSPVPPPPPRPGGRFAPRFCYSYFAPYGDPLLEGDLDPYPDGYLSRLAECGVDGVWLQGVLYQLAPFPWGEARSEGWQTRLENLRRLVARCRRRGIGVWLYLNEPRAMPPEFFDDFPELRGYEEGGIVTLCTSVPAVRQWLRESVETLFAAVPDLAGAFTISASENLTNCWSHHRGDLCPRCVARPAAEVIAEVNRLIAEGIAAGSPTARLIAWDWGWRDQDTADIIAGLPAGVAVQSVSEWSLPIERGGVASEVGEYSISAVGPGPRARRAWELATARGLPAMAKLQIGCTWELSAVPYIPAVELVARHLCNLTSAGVDGMQLGWTLGGYPSPNLELAGVIDTMPEPDPDEAMRIVAERRFGRAAPAVVAAWRAMSRAFEQYPYHIGGLYTGPQQYGPSNLLWSAPTGYRATMVGFPYDDLTSWRSIYPPEVYAAQMERVAEGFRAALALIPSESDSAAHEQALAAERDVAAAAWLHFRTCAQQARYVIARDAHAVAPSAALRGELAHLLREEIDTAERLLAIQCRDSRIGFEASNHYYYVPLDLVEKVLSCRRLLAEL